jgi:UDP-GlcNAc:undecaprenyl-phosphate GlcNAc-1-phosphate transferase
MAFLINLYLTPLLIFLSHKHGFFDKTDFRKIHTEDTSRFGGIGIFISFLISTLLSPFLVSIIIRNEINFQNSEYSLPFLIFSVSIIFLTGILDDFAEMRARYKLLGQLIASILAILGGAVISSIQIPFTEITVQLGYFSIPLTIFWIIGITNSINLIDGIDGLSSGISIFAAMIFGFVFLLHGQYLSAIICFILVGSLFGYLFFNFPPARIFMGDSGSLFLGFLLAVLPIATFPSSGTSLIMPMTMLSIPILDVISAIWRRTRDKQNVFSPDRLHVHHKLLDMGLNNRNILAVIYGLCLLSGLAAILFESSDNNYIFILFAWILVSIFFIYLHYKKKDSK